MSEQFVFPLPNLKRYEAKYVNALAAAHKSLGRVINLRPEKAETSFCFHL
jgi:hypothetical protein